jgi:signal transduction histidine kinase
MRLGLRARITALLLVLSIAPPGAVVWFIRERVLALVRAEDVRRVEDALAEFGAAIQREGGDATQSLATVGSLLEDDPRYRTVPSVRPGGAPAAVSFQRLADAAPRLMEEAGLDCLSILDATGVVISSGHAPASVGLLEGDKLRMSSTSASFVEENITPGIGRVLTLQSRRTVELPGGTLHLVGGRFLDWTFLRRLSPAGTVQAVLLDRDGNILTASDPRNPLPVTADWSAASPGGGELLVRGVPHTVRTIRLRDQKGDDVGTLLAAVSQERLLKMSSSLSLLALVVVASGVLGSLVVALVLARGVTGPLRKLEEMAGRIAEERYEPLADAAGQGEVGTLVASFNRMAASLADSRERLRQTERLAAGEEVARRVAHEIKNPLSPILLTLEGLVKTRRLRPQEFDAAFDEAVRTIQEEIHRMRGMLDDFGRFGRLPLPRPRPTDLNDLVRAVLPLYAENTAGAAIASDLDPSLGAVLIDPDRMSEVINNLLLNAVQALGAGSGIVTVTTRAVGDGIELCVLDTGPGLRPEVLQRLFEPYVSTRPGGSGLGLAIARRIVLDHGGRIKAGNRPEGGAEVRVFIPSSGRKASVGH